GVVAAGDGEGACSDLAVEADAAAVAEGEGAAAGGVDGAARVADGEEAVAADGSAAVAEGAAVEHEVGGGVGGGADIAAAACGGQRAPRQHPAADRRQTRIRVGARKRERPRPALRQPTGPAADRATNGDVPCARVNAQ